MSKQPPAPDGDVGPELVPRADFNVWVQPEALQKEQGFRARGYWVFGSRLNPKIRIRIRLGGVMYRITLSPIGKESWPQRSVLDRHLVTEAAMQARDYGAPQGIGGMGDDDTEGTNEGTDRGGEDEAGAGS